MANSRFICYKYRSNHSMMLRCPAQQIRIYKWKALSASLCHSLYNWQSNTRCFSEHMAADLKVWLWRWWRAMVPWELIINLQSSFRQWIGLWDWRWMTESKWISSGARAVCSGITASINSRSKVAATVVSYLLWAENNPPRPCLTTLCHMYFGMPAS